MNKRLLELAVLPMILQAPGEAIPYERPVKGPKGITSTKAARRKKRAQRRARKHNR